MQETHLWVIMGPCGCGKSTVGKYLSRTLGFTFVEGDDYHSDHNRKKMLSKTPLTDNDRASWLLTLSATAVAAATTNHVAVACSALKEAYRDFFRLAVYDSQLPIRLHFMYLEMGEELAKELVEMRAKLTGHYMPAALVKSQYDTLEKPGEDEVDCYKVDAGRTSEEMKVDALDLTREVMGFS